jgi:hypothetical protein
MFPGDVVVLLWLLCWNAYFVLTAFDPRLTGLHRLVMNRLLEHHDERKVDEAVVLILERLLAGFGAAITTVGLIDKLAR